MRRRIAAAGQAGKDQEHGARGERQVVERGCQARSRGAEADPGAMGIEKFRREKGSIGVCGVVGRGKFVELERAGVGVGQRREFFW